MTRRIFAYLGLLIVTIVLMAFALANIKVKGRPLWCYLNTTLVLRGGQSYQMSRELEEITNTEKDYYLVLGSSHAYRGYDPGFFKGRGISVFNAGSSAQSLSCSFVLLKHYRPKFNKVILDIFPETFCISSDESRLTLMQSTPNPRLAFQLFKIDLNLFTINNLFYRWLRLDEKPLYQEEGYVGRGYVITEQVLDKTVSVPECHFDNRQYDILISMIEYCRRENIDLTLVSHPLPIPAGRPTGYHLFRSRIDKITKDYKIPFYDYTYKYNLDNTYFMDYNHLNKKGVEFFNRKFIRDKFGID